MLCFSLLTLLQMILMVCLAFEIFVGKFMKQFKISESLISCLLRLLMLDK